MFMRRCWGHDSAFVPREDLRETIVPDLEARTAQLVIHGACDMSPWHRIAPTRRWREPAGCLPNDFEIADDRVPDHLLSHKDVAATGNIRFDRRDTGSDMLLKGLVRLHSGVASASMYGRKYGLTLRASTRSTLRWNTASSASAKAR